MATPIPHRPLDGPTRPAPANPPAAGHPPAGPDAGAPASPASPVSPASASSPPFDRLVEAALDAGRDVRPGRATRADGWTPARIAAFLGALADTGTVAAAARAAGMSGPGAYALRNRAAGRPFALAWDAAVRRARPPLAETPALRAIHGWDEPVFYRGRICGWRRRYDHRLALRLLGRLDRRAERSGWQAAVRVVADEFEEFVGLVAQGGEGVADFVRERLRPGGRAASEAELLRRADHFVRFGAGLRATSASRSPARPAGRVARGSPTRRGGTGRTGPEAGQHRPGAVRHERTRDSRARALASPVYKLYPARRRVPAVRSRRGGGAARPGAAVRHRWRPWRAGRAFLAHGHRPRAGPAGKRLLYHRLP